MKGIGTPLWLLATIVFFIIVVVVAFGVGGRMINLLLGTARDSVIKAAMYPVTKAAEAVYSSIQVTLKIPASVVSFVAGRLASPFCGGCDPDFTYCYQRSGQENYVCVDTSKTGQNILFQSIDILAGEHCLKVYGKGATGNPNPDNPTVVYLKQGKCDESYCPNYICEPGEQTSCPSDCEAVCGDGTCQTGENIAGDRRYCPGDCTTVETLVVDFTFAPASPKTGEITSFTSSVSGGNVPYTYAWKFGDGAVSSERDPQHSYSYSDTFTVTLTVIDTDYPAQSKSVSKSITIGSLSGCTCASWVNRGCGLETCAYSTALMHKTRTCSPSGCEIESLCVESSSCS